MPKSDVTSNAQTLNNPFAAKNKTEQTRDLSYAAGYSLFSADNRESTHREHMHTHTAKGKAS